MAKSSGSSSRPTSNGQAQPKVASNRIVNKHPRLPQYPRSLGASDVDVTFGVNITTPNTTDISPRSNSPANQPARPSSGSIVTSTNKYRRNGSSD
jgi:hypothetical protein